MVVDWQGNKPSNAFPHSSANHSPANFSLRLVLKALPRKPLKAVFSENVTFLKILSKIC
jgi:hypothetical protein